MNLTHEKRSFDQKYKFSKKNDMVCAWRNFKNIFPRPLFTIILKPKILFFVTYSILTGNTKVEFVIYWVLNRSMTFAFFRVFDLRKWYWIFNLYALRRIFKSPTPISTSSLKTNLSPGDAQKLKIIIRITYIVSLHQKVVFRITGC